VRADVHLCRNADQRLQNFSLTEILAAPIFPA